MANQDILNGAEFLAAAETLGLSRDEAIAAVARKQQKLVAREGVVKSPDEMAQMFINAAQRVQAVNAEMPADIDNFKSVDQSIVDFGEGGNQDELQNFGGVDAKGRIANAEAAIEEQGKVRGRRDPNVFRKFEKVKGKDGRREVRERQIVLGPNQPLRDRELREQEMMRDFGLRVDREVDERGGFIQRGGKRLWREAGQEVKGPRFVQRPEKIVPIKDIMAPGAQILGERLGAIEDLADAPGFSDSPEVARILGRIEDNIRPDAGAEAALAAELARADRRVVNPLQEIKNELDAQIEAQQILRKGVAAQDVMGKPINLGGRRFIERADEAIANMGVIRNLGKAGMPQDFNVGQDIATRALNPRNLMMGLDAEEANAPFANARAQGPLRQGDAWLVANMPDHFGADAMKDWPQLAIDEQLQNAYDAIARIKIAGQGVDIPRIKNANGLAQAANAVIALGQAKKQGFFRPEEILNEQGVVIGRKNVLVENPGIDEVLNKARFNDNQKAALANALFQIEAANRGDRNQVRKQMFALGMPMEANVEIAGGADAPEFGGGGAKIARINREKVKKRNEQGKLVGVDIKGELQKLDGRQADPPLDAWELRDARMPFQAGVAGQPIPRAGFIRGADRGKSEAEIAAQFGTANAAIAKNVEARFLADEARRAVPEGQDPVADRLRERERVFGVERDARSERDRVLALQQAADDLGKPLGGNQRMLGPNKPMAFDPKNPEGKFGVNIVPSQLAERSRPVAAPASTGVVAAPSTATSAVVNPAPQPAATMAQQGSGYLTSPPSPVNEFKNLLGDFNSNAENMNPQRAPQQGPVMNPNGYDRSIGERAAFVGNKLKGYARSPRFQRGRRIAYGTGVAGTGLVGLDALIGGERDRREEEVYA